MSINEQLRAQADLIFNNYLQKYAEIEMICLSTSDGFHICSASVPTVSFDPDTMAAASSTLFSVSGAVSQQILNKSFRVTFIESEQGNVAFVVLHIAEFDFVMAMSANSQMNIGQLRVFIHRVSEELTNSI